MPKVTSSRNFLKNSSPFEISLIILMLDRFPPIPPTIILVNRNVQQIHNSKQDEGGNANEGSSGCMWPRFDPKENEL